MYSCDGGGAKLDSRYEANYLPFRYPLVDKLCPVENLSLKREGAQLEGCRGALSLFTMIKSIHGPWCTFVASRRRSNVPVGDFTVYGVALRLTPVSVSFTRVRSLSRSIFSFARLVQYTSDISSRAFPL